MPIGEMAALGAAIIWASTSIAFTSAGRISTPTAANTFKTVAAVFLFGSVFLIRDGVPWGRGVPPADIALLALSGLVGLSLGDSLLFRGFVTLGTRRAMLVFSLNPVIGALGGYLFLGERLGGAGIAGMVIALAGIALVVGEKRRAAPDGLTHPPVPDCGAVPCPDRGFLHRHVTLAGVLFSVGGAAGQAVGALLAKPSLARVDTLAATQIRATAGAAGLLLFALLGGHLAHWTRLILRGRILARLCLASFFGPFIGLFLMVLSIKRAPTGIALTLLSTTPIWLLPLGAWFQKDRPSPREAVGAVIALAGTALLLLR
ncbi:MAG: DMT family transporter [Candidatus Eisenbacteria bacterium]|nr:DMT family transporter [Candidatus Eisenbacteria bacterium]